MFLVQVFDKIEEDALSISSFFISMAMPNHPLNANYHSTNRYQTCYWKRKRSFLFLSFGQGGVINTKQFALKCFNIKHKQIYSTDLHC